jgi:hypothetical protein
MRGVNYLKAKALITSDEVIFHAPTDSHQDPRVIMQSILVAERRFIKPMLGASVYDELAGAKNILVNSANKDLLEEFVNTGRPADRKVIVLALGDIVNSDEFLNVDQLYLWNEYLHKIIAECVWFSALPVNRARFTAKGVVKNFPDQIGAINTESVSTDLPDIKHLMDRGLLDRINPLMNDLHSHLCYVKYAGYDKDCGCDDRGRTQAKKSGIVFGMYDDDQDCGCYDQEARAAVASLGGVGAIGGCREETFYFDGVSNALLNWNAARKRCHDGDVTVERMNEDGDYEELSSTLEYDSAGNPTLINVAWEGEEPVRVILT